MRELGVVRALLDELHRMDIAYCHWKSNEHVSAGLAGETDLDLLVARKDADRFVAALVSAGIKHFSATPLTKFPAVEDYLAFDAATGNIVHLHVHYQLILGEKHLKGYRFPWEHIVLSSRQYDEGHRVYVADPALELILLLVRCALKLRLRDRLAWAKDRWSQSDSADEFQWLLPRVDIESVVATARELLGRDSALTVQSILGMGRITTASLWRLRREIRSKVASYRSYSLISGRVLRALREYAWLCSILSRKLRISIGPLRRVASRGGVFVAFVGPDGSGKSTLARQSATWLSKKIDVLPVYLGSGDGPCSLARWPLRGAMRLRWRLRGGGVRNAESEAPQPPRVVRQRGLAAYANALWCVTLVHERRDKLRRVTYARNRGVVVIADRLPQEQNPGVMDGPLLSGLVHSRRPLLARTARWERDEFRRFRDVAPDVVIKLCVNEDTAVSRRPNMRSADIRVRATAVRDLDWPAPTRVVCIDANRPLEQVLIDVKRCIWEAI